MFDSVGRGCRQRGQVTRVTAGKLSSTSVLSVPLIILLNLQFVKEVLIIPIYRGGN